MIDVKELRVGNIIDSSFRNRIVIDPVHFIHIHTHPVDYSPVELTEEILLKCGFEPTEYDKELSLELIIKDIYYIRINIRPGYYCKIDVEVTSVEYDLIYLHQLQNIVFALTGEELVINI